jgi:hypothetical protein
VVENFIKRKFSEVRKSDSVLRAALTVPQPVSPAKYSAGAMTVREEARLFLEILGRADLKGLRLIVLNLTHYTLDAHSFISELEQMKNDTLYPSYIREMKLVDATSFLQPDDYYVIDDHLNASGHRKVAEAIARMMD